MIFGLMATGARVRNTYVIYLLQRDSLRKLELIPHNTNFSHELFVKAPAVIDEHASH